MDRVSLPQVFIFGSLGIWLYYRVSENHLSKGTEHFQNIPQRKADQMDQANKMHAKSKRTI